MMIGAEFFNHPIFLIFKIIGMLSTTLALIGFFHTVVAWFCGVSPLLWRLGMGRWRRRIAIVAGVDSYSVLRNALVNSGVFRRKKVEHITKVDLSRIKNCSLLLVDYPSMSDYVEDILEKKEAQAGMVFYCPSENGQVPEDILKKIGDTPNTALVNFRGRLLSDVLTMLITTSYAKEQPQ